MSFIAKHHALVAIGCTRGWLREQRHGVVNSGLLASSADGWNVM